jgi:hypothetical protein
MEWELEQVERRMAEIRADLTFEYQADLARASLTTAEATAGATRTTARATVVLAVATAFLIVATIVAAVIASQ